MILRGEGSLGDAVISSFVFREIKKQYPDIKIEVAAFGAGYDYFSQNSYIDRLHKLPIKSRIRWNQYWLKLLLFAINLRRKNYDLVVDPSDIIPINWHFFKKLCSKKRSLFDIKHNKGEFGNFEKHRSEHEKLVFESLGFKNLDTSYDIYTTKESNERIRKWKLTNKVSDFVCLNAYGSVKERTFNKNTIDIVIRNLPEDMNFIIPCILGKNAETNELIPDKYKARCFVFETKSVFELIGLIQNSSFVISPDTAAIHIACGCKKPLIGFYNNYTNYYSPNNMMSSVIKTDNKDVNKFNITDLQNSINFINQNLNKSLI